MSGKTKVILLGLAFLVLGAALIVTAGMGSGFRYDSLSADDEGKQVLKSISEPFDSVEIGSDLDVQILPAADGSCVLSVWESENLHTDVEIRDGLLLIEIRDEEPWYQHLHINIGSWESPSATLYLPEHLYRSLTISTSSGDVELGRIRLETLQISTASGELELNETQAQSVSLQSASGDIACFALEPELLRIATTSGAIGLHRVSAASIQLQSTSGDMKLERVDAGLYQLQTTSGDIEIRLSTPHSFSVHTTSGEIEAPASLLGESESSITTLSGDIEIEAD